MPRAGWQRMGAVQMTDDARRPGYFDDLYRDNPDPWRFETSDYEARKYDATIAALPAGQYGAAVEVGCSIGVLTARLAARADTVLGIDVAQAAIDRAAVNCAALANVEFARMTMPEAMPDGRFNLIMLSEVLYYFESPTLVTLAERLQRSCAPSADIVMVHWLGPTPDYPHTGGSAVEAFMTATAPWTEALRQTRHDDYRIDVLRVVRAR